MITELHDAFMRAVIVTRATIKTRLAKGEWLSDFQADTIPVRHIPRSMCYPHTDMSVRLELKQRKDPAKCIIAVVLECRTVPQPWSSKFATFKRRITIGMANREYKFREITNSFLNHVKLASELMVKRVALYERCLNLLDAERLGLVLDAKGIEKSFDAMGHDDIRRIHREIDRIAERMP